MEEEATKLVWSVTTWKALVKAWPEIVNYYEPSEVGVVKLPIESFNVVTLESML